MPENFNALNDILEEFHREVRELDGAIERNQQRIRETDAYVSSLMDSETEDFRVFSPIKAEVLYKEELEKAREKKSVCEAEMEKLSLRRELLTGYMEKLENVLSFLEQDARLRSREAADLQKESVEHLEHLSLRIEKASSDIERRPVQAKQDLLVIAKNIKEITDKIRNTMWMEGI